MTSFIEVKLEDVAKIEIMPRNLLLAKKIADDYLEHARLINTIRNIWAYTGIYKGKMYCSETFYPETLDYQKLNKEYKCLGNEMESFVLFHDANVFGKNC